VAGGDRLGQQRLQSRVAVEVRKALAKVDGAVLRASADITVNTVVPTLGSLLSIRMALWSCR